MTLGQRIKNLRHSLEMSQPDLAEAMGVEQSYISKLENDKSFPSDDMFTALLGALNTDVKKFLEGFDESTIKGALSKLTAVNDTLTVHKQGMRKFMLRWVLVSAALIVLGVTCYLAADNRWFMEYGGGEQFRYESKGVVFAGEPLHLFDQNEKGEDEIMRRLEHQVERHFTRNGDYYVKEVAGGYRLFKLTGSKIKWVVHPMESWFYVLGVLLFCSGVVGLLIEPKIRRIREMR
mgnify:FL=1